MLLLFVVNISCNNEGWQSCHSILIIICWNCVNNCLVNVCALLLSCKKYQISFFKKESQMREKILTIDNDNSHSEMLFELKKPAFCWLNKRGGFFIKHGWHRTWSCGKVSWSSGTHHCRCCRYYTKITFLIWSTRSLILKGIGKATAIRLAQEGCTVIATDINKDALKSLEGISGIF